MAAVQQTGMVPIIQAIQFQLLARISGLTSSMIKLSAHLGEVPHFDAEHDIVIRVGSYISFTVEPAARTAQRIKRFLIVYPRVRMALDPMDRDTQWLISPTGQIQWEETVLRALWGYFVNDTGNSETGNLLSWVEMQMSGTTDPVKGAIDKSWGNCAQTYEIEYLFALQQDALPG